MAQTAQNVFRDFVVDGVASSGANKVKKAEVRELLTGYEAAITGFQAGGGIIFQTKASMTLGYAANVMAWVIGDSTAANNGVYQKQGTSGTGSWLRLADLPYSFIKATNAGAGSANAIIATSSIPIPAADGGALITVNVAAENTGAATVSFNGGAPLNIVSSSGNAMLAGYLKPGMQLAGFKVGSDFRLLTDIASASIVAAAAAEADRAEAAVADTQAASQAAIDAMSSVVPNIFATRTVAEAYSPTAAPAFFNTAGFAAAGDGGAALYKPSASPFGDSLQSGGGDGGWTASNGTLTPGADYLTYATTNVDSNLLKSGLSLNGAKCRYIVIDLEVIAGSAEEVTLYYATAGHSFDPGYRKVAPAGISTGLRRALIFDMHDLTDGGADWANSTITELRLDLTNAASAEFRIRAIAASKHAGVLPITLDDGGDTVAWYEVASDTLRPEMFGEIGIDAAGDTVAWSALVSVANDRGGRIKIKLPDELNLNGTGTASDSQTFTNFTSIWIRGTDTEIYQHSSLAKTFKFKKAGGKVKVTGVEFVGYAEQQINASITPNEINFDASSGNAVAAIYAEDLEEVDISRVTTRNHAGRDIDCRGVLKLKARDCELVGLGPLYNRPVQDGHQGNGEDAAIYFIPKVTAAGDPTHGTYYDPVTSTAYRAILDVCNCEVRWHSFCIRTILNKAIILHGNYFGETPGQHHVYDTDSDGHDIVGNIFEKCRQVGYKMQFENLPGFNYGKAWEPSKAYAVGDIVRAVSIVWRCKTAHTSGGTFSSTNWEQHERYIRRGGVWTGNQFKGCDQGIGIIESSQVDGRNIWSEGYNISGNYFAVIGTAIYIDRLWKAQIIGNTAHGGQFGIFGRNFCGSIRSNNFWDQTRNSVCISISKTTSIEDNGFFNFGTGGTGDDTRAGVLIYAPNAVTAPPVNSAQPRIFFTKNNISNFVIGGTAEAADAPGQYLVFDADTRNLWYIQDTYGTQTTKKFRIDGTIALQFRNHFINNGYANVAQNDSTPGDIGTLLTALRAKFVVKNP